MLTLRLGIVAAFVLAACGSNAPPPKAAPRDDAPITAADRTTLCEVQADRAARCPGPPPEAIATCTARMECFGELIRPEVVRGLTKCTGDTRDCRPCTLERAALSVKPTNASRELAAACRRRHIVCPALDCEAIVRPVLPLSVEATTPLVDCMTLGGTCLEVAACVLEQMRPIADRANRCAPPDDALDAGLDGG